MRILYIENVRIPSERAHAYQIVQTCAWFARLGHEVVLVNPDRAGGADVFAAFGLPSGLFRHVRLPVSDPLSWPWFRFKKLAYLWQRFSFARAVRRWAATQQADVWYTRDPAMVDILRRPDRLVALELHDAPDAHPARWSRIKNAVSRFVVITHGLGQKLRELGIPSASIVVASDGYDPADFTRPGDRAEERARLGIPQDAFVAIYTGSFYPWKGVDHVVEAWPGTDARAHLVLIGGPAGDRSRIERRIDPRVADRVHVIPTMQRTSAIRALAAADVGLLTSSDREEIGRVYTSPLKQFEYLAAGLPVLASDVPSSHEVLTSEVAQFYSRDRESCIAVLTRVMEDPSWRRHAADRSREIVAPYTWEARANTIIRHLVGDLKKTDVSHTIT
jgi:glycosyltransferase involved in cell wall biosynthesis